LRLRRHRQRQHGENHRWQQILGVHLSLHWVSNRRGWT
jgi:hypothetical protein